MGRSNRSTDALIEIISLCEQALIELTPEGEAVSEAARTDKLRHFRRHQRAKMMHRLLLVPGGLSMAKRRVTDR